MSKKLSKASEVMDVAYLKGGPIMQETVSDLEDLNVQEYNFSKTLGTYFVPIEETEKKSVAHEVRISSEINDIRGFKKSPYQTPSVNDLRTELKQQEWSGILSMTDRLIHHLGNDVLPHFINQLVLATEDLNSEVQSYPYLFSVFSALNIYYKDIMVYHALGHKIEAIKRAQRSKDILEFGVHINEMNKRKGIDLLKASDFEKIDEIDGRPIYAFKQ